MDDDRNIPEGYYTKFHKSTLDPILMGGIDRNLCFALWSIGLSIGFMMQLYWFLAIAFFVHMVIRRLTKEDKDFFVIIKDHIHSKRCFW